MATCKFKIGDHVVVEKSNVSSWNYGGKTGVINRVDPYYEYPYRIKMDDGSASSWCTVSGLVSNSEKIVITHDGKVTTATMYGVMGKKTTATARCAPEDKFDFLVGAKLAMERLMEKVTGSEPKVEPPKYWTGRVVCIQTDNDAHDKSFNVGRIYKVDNGKFTDNLNRVRPISSERVSSPEDLTAESGYFSDWAYKFIPLVEDEEKPLTIEELNKMDGQKVWLQSLDSNKNPYLNNFCGGWHTVNVKDCELISCDSGRFYRFNANDVPYGFHAYRQAPRK